MAMDLANLATTAFVAQMESLRDAVRQAVEPLAEREIWSKPVQPGNSVGRLVLHLAGNLNHFVGAQLGATGYLRDREREFTETNRPTKHDVLAGLDEAIATFRRVILPLDADGLSRPHPERRFGTVLGALVHLTAHFALHRGQISYLVRLSGLA